MEHWLNDVRTFFDPAQYKIKIGSRDFFGLWPVSISLKRFNTHLYVVGASGQGKSKFLQHVLHQLSTKGWGCGLFDPHSDLASDLLAQLGSYPGDKPWISYPENRRRILYLDPSRSDYIVPCNVLKNPYSSPYEIAENVVEAFRRVWPETLAEAPRFAQIMRNAVLVLIECGLSLLEMEPLLTDGAFRTRMLAHVNDPLVVSFFRNQFDRWGPREQPIFISPVLNKISAFLFKPQVRYMLGAEENRLDFRKLMDTKQLKGLLTQIEALKTSDTTEEFQAGVDAAKNVISAVLQEAADQEKIQKLEAELATLRARYPSDIQAAPKKRGRKPKSAVAQEEAMLEAE